MSKFLRENIFNILIFLLLSIQAFMYYYDNRTSSKVFSQKSMSVENFSSIVLSKSGLTKIGSEKLGFWEVFQGPGGFRRVREACRIHFHLSWYLSDSTVPSYDQKPWGKGIFSFIAGITRNPTMRNRDSRRLVFLNFLI